MPDFNYFAGKPFSIAGARSNYLKVGEAPSKEDELRLSKTWVKKKGGKPAPPLSDGKTQRIFGITMYAGQQSIVGTPDVPGFNTSAEYADARFQAELEEEYGGDLDAMSKRKAYDPAFMRWKQEKSTGGFAAMREKAKTKRRELADSKLQKLAYEIRRPLPQSAHEAIKMGLHGTSASNRTRLEHIKWHDEKAKETLKYREEMRVYRLGKEGEALVSEARKVSPKRLPTAGFDEPGKPATLVKKARKKLSDEANKVLALLLDKLEVDYSPLSRGLRALDKGGMGLLKVSELHSILRDRYELGAKSETLQELGDCLDLEGSGMVSISDLQQRMLEAFSWASRDSFSNTIGRGNGARSSAGKHSKNRDLIHRMARSSLAPKYNVLYLSYKAMYPKFPGYVTKNELQAMFKKANVNLEPEQFSLFFSTFEQSDNGAILWRNFLDSIEPGNGANARKIGGVQEDVFVSRNTDRVEIPPWFVEEPDYSKPNHWGLKGTFQHPAGAGYDNRHNIMTYALTTTRRGLNGMARGEIHALMDRSGLKKPSPNQQLTFPRGADDLSGFKKMSGVRGKDQVEAIVGDGFVPRMTATGWSRQLSRPYQTTLHYTTLYCTTPHHTTQHNTTLHTTAPNHTAPRPTPHHTTPHHTTTHHTTTHHTTPHQATPGHTRPD